jgi:Uroporphyrinogen decarboxylase (URO-D)
VSAPLTPRAMIRAILRGEPLSRPLLLPIVFSLGARLENLSLSAFLANPTRIANSQRQIRTVLGLDGVTSYFDPYLEAEALGSNVERNANGTNCICGPAESLQTTLEHRASAEVLVAKSRVPLACDVIRRLKTMLSGEPALMARVSGPCQLWDLLNGDLPREEISNDGVGYCSDITSAVTKSFLDAGANVIFLCENRASIRDGERWIDLLMPIVNVIRFYEALPVVIFSGAHAEESPAALGTNSDGPIIPYDVDRLPATETCPFAQLAAFLPNTSFSPNNPHDQAFARLLSIAQASALAIVTSRGEIPADVDLKQLADLSSALRRISRSIG